MRRDARELEGALISEIYAALLGHGDWQSFLDHLTCALPNGKATLFYHDFAARSGALSINARVDPGSIAAYNRHYAANNPWMPKVMTRPLGLGVRAEKMLPREDLVRTEFYTDFMRPQGLCTGVGVTIFRDHGCNFMLSLLSGSAEEVEADAAAELLGRLAPHLRQAFTYYRGGTALAKAPSIVGAATEALGVAFVVIGIERRMMSANAAGRELLSLGDPIGLDGRERITTPSSDIRDALDSALNAAVRGETISKRTIALKDNSGRPRRVTLVVPELGPFERYFAGPCVLILVEESRSQVLPSLGTLQQAFALTPAEAKLALAIAKCETVSRAADALRISKLTARTQLKSIFAKMDVHRQAELVAKVHKLDPRN